MASRQAGFFVQHTEKIVLAVSAAFALMLVLVSWAGVFGSPASTQVGSQTVSPGNVAEVVSAEADKLRRALDQPEPGVPDVTIPSYSDQFAERIAAPLLPSGLERLGAPISAGGIPPEAFVAQANDFPTYRLPGAPVVDRTVVKIGTAVLVDPGSVSDQRERQQVAEIGRELELQPGAPGDFQYVSVMARFPMREWADRLEAPDPDRTTQPIPQNVWRPRLGLAAVYLLRQRLSEQTGDWGEAEVVSPLPGQLAYLPGTPAGAEDLTAAENLVSFLRENQPQVAQVPFPPTVYKAWTPPGGMDRVFTDAEATRLKELDREIKALQDRIDRELNREAPAARGNRRGQAVGDDDPGGGFGQGGGNFGGPPRGVTPRATRGRDRPERDDGASPEDRRMQLLEDELQAFVEERHEMMGDDAPEDAAGSFGGRTGFPGGGDEFDDNGDDFNPGPGFRGGQPGRVPGGLRGRPGGGRDGEVPEEVTVWAHDLSGQPGATYRYKLVAAPMNPLFRYGRVEESQREANRDRIALGPSDAELQGAEWSPQVTLNPQADFFFLGGNAEQDRARVEVWKVYDGLWQKAEFEESSGNGIGGEEMLDVRGRRERVDLATGALLLDIDTQQALEGNPDQRMIFQAADGVIEGRTRQSDLDSERRLELEGKLEAQSAEVADAR